MLKISWSRETESSTTTTTSVCGLKYIPGLTTRSSSSTIRSSTSVSRSGAMADAILPCGREPLLAEVLEVAELALDLGVDVQRLLTHSDPPLVAGDDELADLLAQLPVGGQGGGGALAQELLELALHVERRLPAGGLAVGLRLEELADLRLAHGGGLALLARARRGARAARAPGVEVALELDRELALADLPEGAAGPRGEGHGGEREGDEEDQEEDVLHRQRRGDERVHGARIGPGAGRGAAPAAAVRYPRLSRVD